MNYEPVLSAAEVREGLWLIAEVMMALHDHFVPSTLTKGCRMPACKCFQLLATDADVGGLVDADGRARVFIGAMNNGAGVSRDDFCAFNPIPLLEANYNFTILVFKLSVCGNSDYVRQQRSGARRRAQSDVTHSVCP